ncbi:MAG: tRNA (adenosine(37)-N6)-threonylcarbamoyltransferase complex ATPase subunit type 1 TsaE [Candidatus Neomarinimicrobiota bacterium]
MSLKITSQSADETIQFGKTIAACLKPGAVVAFIGELAAGKTTMINGICQGLGVPRPAESPTFTLVNEYPGPIYHIDCYREQRLAEWLELGINEYFYGEGITLVEWADRIRPLLPEATLFVNLQQDFGNEYLRFIEIDGQPEILHCLAKQQTINCEP